MQGGRHVIADAACDADPLRACIADGLGATAQVEADLDRACKPPIGCRPCNEGPRIERFFHTLTRLRRVALRCEKTLPASRASSIAPAP